jgi:alpha-D-ribose 1-methylphosphonate 5-triphosphate synthase subunit PhnH
MSAQLAEPVLAKGFDDPVGDSQAAFRAAMWALARPGRVEPLATDLNPPAPLSPEAASLALALCDYETPLWLDATLAAVPEVADFLRFHTGAAILEEPGEARFAILSDPLEMPDFGAFPQGSPEFPDASATLIVQVAGFSDARFILEGPGIKGKTPFGAAPLPADFATRMAANRALFPRGVDLLLVGPGGVAGLPRSVTVREG